MAKCEICQHQLDKKSVQWPWGVGHYWECPNECQQETIDEQETKAWAMALYYAKKLTSSYSNKSLLNRILKKSGIILSSESRENILLCYMEDREVQNGKM